jgi:hypothetical protein
MTTAATADERELTLFPVVTNKWFVEGLAASVCDRFSISADDARALATLHTEREAERERFQRFYLLTPVRGFVVAVIAVLATQIPKDSFEAVGWGHAYGWYRIALIAALISLLFYLSLFRATARFVAKRGGFGTIPTPPAVREGMRLVLLHCELVAPETKAPAGGS